ncbi:MAG: pyridoxamine kinase [Clostridiales bacterium]|jgi:pyridoxine kinase|nr:pyridoxamine kinase [Clostridiales bacterium]
MQKQKRVAAIQDISGFGKCSLTVALPILSAAGIETAIMPTAVLSTHTGGFSGYTYRDLTDDMRPFAAHWKSVGIKFDAIYSGFLGSRRQIEIVKEFISDFRTDGCIAVVDPAMADNGKMYALFDMKFATEMASLCAVADIIVPNITEAVFMLGREYSEGPFTKKYIESLLFDLAEAGPSKVVLTGIGLDEGRMGAASYDKETGEVFYAMSKTIPGMYHGTGDIYASALIAAYLKGRNLADSARIAVDFVYESIKRTSEAGTDVRFGIDFETGLLKLAGDINNV